jgi:hypothetical protein
MANGAVAVRTRSSRLERAEPIVRRLLLVPEKQPQTNGGQTVSAGETAAHRMFNVSIALSGLRCLLGYVILPVVTPVFGAAARVGPVVGIPIAVVALVFDVIAVRRFWVASHRWRWGISAIYVVVMAMVLALLIGDAAHLA